ncbi:hypothetical protein [Paracoccus sp. 22332]|uniref:hypothetical protein n=1 Tax=Paracoccus sp. 22332 TaxID=3453913 RepID=UPI003F87AA55
MESAAADLPKSEVINPIMPLTIAETEAKTESLKPRRHRPRRVVGAGTYETLVDMWRVGMCEIGIDYVSQLGAMNGPL